MAHRLLSIDEAASYVREQSGVTDINATWIRNRINRGCLGAVVVARKRRVRQDKLDELIAGWVKAAA